LAYTDITDLRQVEVVLRKSDERRCYLYASIDEGFLSVYDYGKMPRGLSNLLASYPNIEVAGEASEVEEGLALADEFRPLSSS
jgi:hypothetical protein